jgi:hypothetical protein
MSASSDVTIEQLADWLYCLRTPVVAVYGIEQSTGFILVDSGVVGHGRSYHQALAQVRGGAPEDVR